MIKLTPIESILDEMDFTYNEHILKNADKLKQQEKDFWQKENKNVFKFLLRLLGKKRLSRRDAFYKRNIRRFY
jgi:hypothetical protein